MKTGDWTFDTQKFNIPLNKDGSPDIGKLQKLGLTHKQTDKISKYYSNNELTEAEKYEMYTIMYKATQRAGADIYRSSINKRAQDFMQESVSRQKDIYYKQGKQIPNESR